MSTISTLTPSTPSAATPVVVPDERTQARLEGIRVFLERHTPALHDTLDAVAGEAGAELVEDLVGALSERWPDARRVLDLVSRARDMLAEASFERLDQVAFEGGRRRNIHERVAWFGARLTDLAGSPSR